MYAIVRYGDAASYDRVCLAMPRLCDPDPVAPAFGGLRLLGHLSILFPLTLILVILLDFTYLGSSISCLTECRAADEQQRESSIVSYASALQQPARQTLSISTIRGLMAEAVARDKVRDPVECTDRDYDLVMHMDKDMDMLHSDQDFNVSDVGLTYIDERRQMMCSLLGGHRRAQLDTEEPSSSRRIPACDGGAQFVAEEPSPTEYDDAASYDRILLDFTYLGSSISCLTECSAADEQQRESSIVRSALTLRDWLGGPRGLRPSSAQFVGNWGHHSHVALPDWL
ncbi:hypothetical protein Syun_001782 [Stephania yunnanensis]|uniref:Uncharacterized protein n=1 Tax=Stephania yunnanensis TaxID=152371 RepID=A0AAP0Q6M0_9MAGN